MGHVVCKPSEDGLAVFVPHPYECNKYFECDGNLGIAMTCPEGLVFDPELEICNWPWSVDCVNTPYPTLPTTTMVPETTTSDEPETTTEMPETTTSPQPETTTSDEPETTTSAQPETTTSYEPETTTS